MLTEIISILFMSLTSRDSRLGPKRGLEFVHILVESVGRGESESVPDQRGQHETKISSPSRGYHPAAHDKIDHIGGSRLRTQARQLLVRLRYCTRSEKNY